MAVRLLTCLHEWSVLKITQPCIRTLGILNIVGKFLLKKRKDKKSKPVQGIPQVKPVNIGL